MMVPMEVKFEEMSMLIKILKNGLVIAGCVLLMPAIGFKTALGILFIIYGLNIGEVK